MIEDDSAYLSKRAVAEFEQAQRAAKLEAARVDQKLADAYLDRVKPDPHAGIEQAT